MPCIPGICISPVGKWNEHLPELANTMDYIGVNYYSRRVAAFDLSAASTLFGRTFHEPEAEMDHIRSSTIFTPPVYTV